MFLNDADRERDASGNVPHSVIKSQMGISAGVVWQVKEWLHLDLDGSAPTAAGSWAKSRSSTP